MKTFLRKCLVLIAMLAPLCGVSAQTTVTFDAAVEKTNNNTDLELTKDGVTISIIEDGRFNNGTDYRVYGKNSFTVSSSDAPIIKIDFTSSANASSTNGLGKFTTTVGTYKTSGKNATWENTTNTDVTTVTFTASAQVRITTLTVTLQDDPRTPTTLTFDQESFEFLQGDMGGVISNNLATLSPAIDGAVITYETDNPDIVTNIDNGVVTYSTEKTGIATITAKYAGDKTYKASEAKYTITVTKALTSVAFTDGTNRTYTQGENNGTITFTDAATLTPSNAGSLTYTSDKPEIATVDENGQVTINTNNIGTATITASFAETDTHEASSASYTITVEKAIISGAENYVKIDGNDNFTGKYVMIGHVDTGSKDYILTGITGTNKYYTATELTLNGNQITEIPEAAEGHAVFTITKIETDTEYGYAFCNTTNDNQYIRVAGGNNTVSEVGDTNEAQTHASVNYNTAKEAFDIIFNATGNNYFRFNSQSPRFSSYSSSQQPIQLFRHGYSRDVTNGNFGTLCLPYGGTISGATLYAIEGKQMENGEVKSISLVEVDKVEAGKPYIFQATAEKLVVYYEGEIQATAGNDNGLLGSYNGTAVEAGKYVISNNTVKKCGANSKIGKNRCYIDMDNVPEKTASAAALIINFNDSTDAIESIEANADSRNAIYDLSGRRVKAAQKGLYIVNGKKIIK